MFSTYYIYNKKKKQPVDITEDFILTVTRNVCILNQKRVHLYFTTAIDIFYEGSM